MRLSTRSPGRPFSIYAYRLKSSPPRLPLRPCCPRFIKPILKKDCPGYTFGNCFNKEGHRGVAQRNLALRFIREKLYLYCDTDRVNGILNKDTSDYGHVDPYLGEQGAVLGRGLCPLDEVPRLLQHEPIVYFAGEGGGGVPGKGPFAKRRGARSGLRFFITYLITCDDGNAMQTRRR